jgi:hypothetical protein
VRAAHLLDEPVPAADGDAAVVVLVDEGEDAGVARRYPCGDVGHHGGHHDVAGPFSGVEAAALPGGRESEDFQLGGADLGAAAVLEDDALVGSYSEQVSGRGDEGQQQPRVTGGVR